MFTRSRKAFTLLELIVVIVILGILALLAIPTFQAVIGRAEQSNVDNTALALGRQASALAAFEGASADEGAYANTAIGDLPDSLSATNNGDGTVTVTAVDTGRSACLALGTEVGDSGELVDMVNCD